MLVVFLLIGGALILRFRVPAQLLLSVAIAFLGVAAFLALFGFEELSSAAAAAAYYAVLIAVGLSFVGYGRRFWQHRSGED